MITAPKEISGYINIVESLTFGLVMAVSLAIAFLLKIENPYWVPISCLAVMQGSSSQHIWLRGTQRIIGTLFGLGLTWLIVLGNPSALFMVIAIILLQTIVEFLVVRNYGVAVVLLPFSPYFYRNQEKTLPTTPTPFSSQG